MTSIGRFRFAAIAGALCAAALAAQTGDAVLGPRGGTRPDHGGPCGDQLVQYVGLTSDQQTALETLRQQTADSVQTLADEMHSLRQQIDQLIAAGNPDACAVGQIEIQAAGARAQIDAALTAAEAAFVASLTSSQKTKYDAFVAMNPGCTAIGPGFGPPHPPTRG